MKALVTGASGGIGRAIAEALAPRCSTLLLAGRDAPRLEEASRAAERGCGDCRTVAADLGSAAGLDRVAGQARLAGVDLVVNCAGAIEFAPLAGQSDAAIERIVRTNAIAPMQLVARLLPLLQAQPAACIVNVGSILGHIGYPGCAAYSASKFALRGFTEALRRELDGTRVRVLWLAPRTTRTRLNGARLDALNAELGVACDEPRAVAAALIALLDRPVPERLLGMPERLFARVNAVAPGFVDAGLRRQLPAIRRHLQKGKETP